MSALTYAGTTKNQKLKKLLEAYAKAFEQINNAEALYFYDEKYLDKLVKKALRDYKNGKCIAAQSIIQAIKKFSAKKYNPK
jgi:ABC-type transporter MlaC component